MNRNDVTIFALVTAMVLATASAVVARYPGANFGSIADWTAAAASTFAAGTALYIAHHEARRARATLIEERTYAAEREAEASALRHQERMRTDATVVQTACSALEDGLESFLSAINSVKGQDAEARANYVSAYLQSHRFTGPTSEFAMISPSLSYTTEAAAYLLSAKSVWGAILSRATLLAQPGLSNDRIAPLLGTDDIMKAVRKGHILQWQLRHNQLSDEVPSNVISELEARLSSLQALSGL